MAGDEGSSESGAEALAHLQEEVAETQLPDPILRMLVSVCNRGSLAFAVTIATGGLVIAGVAVGVGTFMADMAAELEARGGTDAEVLSDPLRYLAAIAAEPDPSEDLPVYLHLEHARIRSGNTIIADDVRWRARLTSVDGWSLGAHT